MRAATELAIANPDVTGCRYDMHDIARKAETRERVCAHIGGGEMEILLFTLASPLLLTSFMLDKAAFIMSNSIQVRLEPTPSGLQAGFS